MDILVVVAHGEQAQPVILLGQGPARQGGNQVVLVRSNVLVLVHQYPAETRQQSRPVLVGLAGRQALTSQEGRRLLHQLPEIPFVQAVCAPGEAGAHQPHGQGVAGQYRKLQ